MKQCVLVTLVVLCGCSKDSSPAAPSGPSLSFFVTSATSTTGNLGGLAGADATCQRLARGGGAGRAHLARVLERGT